LGLLSDELPFGIALSTSSASSTSTAASTSYTVTVPFPTTTAPSNWTEGCISQIHLTPTFVVTEPLLVIWCIIALLIGLHCSSVIRSLRSLTGHVTYSITFFLYGVMMTNALIVHCFTADLLQWPLIPQITGYIDVALTSTVGLFWSFNGLVDVGLLKENSPPLYLLMVSSCGSLFYAWYGFIFQHKYQNKGFLILYFGPIFVSALIYGLAQLWRFFRGERSGWYYFVVAELAALIGVVTVFTNGFLCSYLGPILSPWFNSDFWWFLLSDISMYAYYCYFISRKSVNTTYGFKLLPTEQL